MDELRRKSGFFRHGLTRINTDENIYPSVSSACPVRCRFGYLSGVFSVAKAFTLVEVLIVVAILGILAAIVLPLYEDSQRKAKESAAKENLRVLRNAIELYAAQHGGAAPGYPNGNTSSTPGAIAFMNQLILASNSEGQCSTSSTNTTEYPLGPYLPSCIYNPLNDKWMPKFYSTGVALPAAAPGGSYGFVYSPSMKKIKLNSTGTDSDGVLYYDY